MATPTKTRPKLDFLKPQAEAPKSIRPGRDGTGLLQVHLAKETIRQLKHLAADYDTTAKQLVEEALNLLFAEYKRRERL